VTVMRTAGSSARLRARRWRGRWGRRGSWLPARRLVIRSAQPAGTGRHAPVPAPPRPAAATARGGSARGRQMLDDEPRVHRDRARATGGRQGQPQGRERVHARQYSVRRAAAPLSAPAQLREQLGLTVGVIRRTHERARLDVAEAMTRASAASPSNSSGARTAQPAGGRPRPQVLSQGEDVHAQVRNVAQDLPHLVDLLAEAQHQPGLGDGPARVRVAEHRVGAG